MLALACSSTGGLGYAPTETIARSSTGAIVAIGDFSDERSKGPSDLGVVRGGYGNVLKRLYSEQPVAELVARAFSDGLAARGMLAPADGEARYRLSGRVLKLDCNQYFRREAHSDVELLLSTPDGRELLRKRFTAERSQGTAGVGVFASLDSLRALAQEALQETIDTALEDDQLRAALSGSAASPRAPASGSTESRLQELERLRERGLVDDEEYQRKRREVLDAL